MSPNLETNSLLTFLIPAFSDEYTYGALVMACSRRSHRAALLMLQECRKRGKVSLAAYGWALVRSIHPHCHLIVEISISKPTTYNCVVTP